jgi:Raf kinase inhibitor-like YbhB/YbcL family protein
MNAIHDIRSAYRRAALPPRDGSDRLISRHVQLATAAALSLGSPAFESNGAIPAKYSADGENLSPPLRWAGVPRRTKELLLICEDLDAPTAYPFIHWMLYGLSPQRQSLPEGIPAMDPLDSMPDARQSKNSTGQLGYLGPMPPAGDSLHHYHFQLFALDQPVRFNFCPYRNDLIAAMSGRVLAIGELVGTYQTA